MSGREPISEDDLKAIHAQSLLHPTVRALMAGFIARHLERLGITVDPTLIHNALELYVAVYKKDPALLDRAAQAFNRSKLQ